MQRGCNNCCGDLGCRPCPMGWQRGGTDYQRCLDCNCATARGCRHCGGRHNGGHGAGLLGHNDQFAAAQAAGAGMASGDPMAQVAYPYYTTRGPRDFLVNDPPTIGR
ncbi:MAG: hypothetical protein KF752_05170 [Pirellulaceae bacterium]|nr:hypothetical protein [Pirellulaceae bacterium]